MGVLINYPLFHADDANGAPLTGGLLYTYIAGTTTAKATYTTRALAVANANPVVLDSRGEAVVYGAGLYKLILKTSAGVTVWTQDNVQLDTGAGSYVFYVDPSETDQGAAGNGSSLYDILIANGASKSYTVRFSHNGVANTTTYTVSTTFDASSYTNVIFEFENGARLSVATGITLTLYSPGSIVAGNYQIFAGLGTVSFSVDYGMRYLLWGGTGTNEIGINVAPAVGVELTGASLKLASGGEITEFSTDGTMAGNSDLAVPTEKAIVTYLTGSYNISARSRFIYNGGTTAYTVLVNAGKYLCKDKDCGWVSQLTTSAISSPVASTWYYLYLDYSAITSGTAITATELIWSSTAPTWSDTYRQWMNGDDRCIFACLTNATPTNILEFQHDGGDLIWFADYIANSEGAIDPDTTWTDATLVGPGFATKLLATFYQSGTDQHTKIVIYWRTNSQTGDAGHYAATSERNPGYLSHSVNSVPVYTDTSQKIEIKCSASADADISVYTDGWYFPGGM